MDQMPDQALPESPVPHLQRSEFSRGHDDFKFCVKMVNEDQPVANDVVNFYDRLVEDGLKISSGELLAAKDIKTYKQGVDRLWAFAVAAHSLHPDGDQDNNKRFTDGELAGHRQSMNLLESMMKPKANSTKLHDFFARLEQEVLVDNKRPSPKAPNTSV